MIIIIILNKKYLFLKYIKLNHIYLLYKYQLEFNIKFY